MWHLSAFEPKPPLARAVDAAVGPVQSNGWFYFTSRNHLGSRRVGAGDRWYAVDAIHISARYVVALDSVPCVSTVAGLSFFCKVLQ
jgi:hypothetical protein